MEEIAAATTRWDAAVALLRAWRAAGVGAGHRDCDDDFLALHDEVLDHFDAASDETDLRAVDRTKIAEWTAAGTDAVAIDAVAHGLGFAASATFAAAWRARVGGDRHRLRAGDVYPAPLPPWPSRLGAALRTPSGWSTGYAADEHPFVRVHRGGPIAVDVDFTLWRPLRAIADGLDRVATLWPNAGLAELGLVPPRSPAFPVAAVDEVAQGDRVLALLEAALARDATVIVLPELSTTPAIVERVAERLRREASVRLVVCGSWHGRAADGTPANVAEGLLAGRPERLRHRKLAPFAHPFPRDPAKRVLEGIVAADPPVLTVYQADRWRIAILICKDVLQDDVAEAVERAGVNLLLVPAMSETVQPFVDRAGQHRLKSQALTVCVNGPLVWGDAVPQPAAFVSRSYTPGAVIQATATADAALTLFSVHDGAGQIVDKIG